MTSQHTTPATVITIIAIAAAVAAAAIAAAAPAAHAQTPPPAHGPFTIECMMLTGCWFDPTGYAPDFWFWVPIYVRLKPHQYERVWNIADWRWIPENTQ